MANETMNGSMQDNEACTSEHSMPSATDYSVALATYIGAFFDELIRGGVSARGRKSWFALDSAFHDGLRFRSGCICGRG